ncbi:hypothetical protein FQA39_LY13670 [Lamprigera yunnana]|nr:hypothetical protein FQA39_LY13670 [Lamprigera yunnana]
MCGSKHHVNVENFAALVKTIYAGGASVESFTECLLQTMGYINDNGEISYEEIKKSSLFGVDKVTAVVDKCKNDKGDLFHLCNKIRIWKVLVLFLIATDIELSNIIQGVTQIVSQIQMNKKGKQQLVSNPESKRQRPLVV